MHASLYICMYDLHMFVYVFPCDTFLSKSVVVITCALSSRPPNFHSLCLNVLPIKFWYDSLSLSLSISLDYCLTVHLYIRLCTCISIWWTFVYTCLYIRLSRTACLSINQLYVSPLTPGLSIMRFCRMAIISVYVGACVWRRLIYKTDKNRGGAEETASECGDLCLRICIEPTFIILPVAHMLSHRPIGGNKQQQSFLLSDSNPIRFP